MIPNLGDIDAQALAGAVATGTHGSGKRFTNISGTLRGGRMIAGTGEVVEFCESHNHELLHAARVSLGSLGIFTALTIRLVPAVKLIRQEWCTHIETCMEHIEQLNEEHRNVDFYWYPRSDLAKIRTWNPLDQQPPELPSAKLVKEQTGWGKDMLGTQQLLRCHESEYSVPAEAGLACFRENSPAGQAEASQARCLARPLSQRGR